MCLQDNEDKRQGPRHRSASHSEDHKSRSRHSSGASTTKRRIRANSSSSNHHNECFTTKKLRVEVTKLDLSKTEHFTSDLSSSDEQLTEAAEEQQRSQRNKLRTRQNNVSPSSKKRRSELDKLLEAGLSSFHCETAKQAADRLGMISSKISIITISGQAFLAKMAVVTKKKILYRIFQRLYYLICFLGPLQVDVSDNNSGSEASSHEDKPTNNKSKNSRLLQECSSSGADVNQNSKGQATGKKRGRKPKNKSKTATDDLSDAFSPNSTCESPIAPEFDELNDVDGTELNHQDMEFSFERTPHREGWFQAYSRQDLGDEILYYSDHQFFPLPYEMPMSTFLPWRSKEKSGKKSTKNTPEASGTATPINIAAEDEDSNFSSTPMRATRACKSNKKNLNEASFFDKIDPKKAAALRAADLFSRKSPRGHASTKSLLNNSTSPYVEDDEYFEELLQNDQSRLAYLDECSMDSELSASRLDNRGEESIGELIEIANRLDAFFCEEDPLPTSEKKRSRRQSSNSEQNKSKRHGRRSKDSHHDQADNGLDKIVNSHVDPVFLDCLEDELPSVTFDDPIRSNNDPMKWINTYDQCTSINLFSKKNKKFSQKHIANSNSTPPASEEKIKKERDSSIDENESLVISHSKDAASATILRRLLTDSGSKNTKSTKNTNRPLIKPKLIADDSSSECASVSESVASSNSARRKKKRNMTGFPSPKKKKKLITPALTPKAGLNKRLGRKAKEIEEASTSTRKTKKTNNKSTSRSGGSGTSRTVQMQLKLNKNGISLQKPTKQQSPHKTGKRGRPPLKSKHHSKQTQQTKKSRTSSSSVVPKHSQKSKPAINPAEVIDIVSSSPDDDDDDTTYGSNRGKNGKRKNKKKKRKRLCLKQRKKFLLVKPGSKPKVITLDSDDNIDQVPDSASESENETENDDKNSNTSDEDSNDEEQVNDSSAEEASEAGDESDKNSNSSDESGSGSGSGEEEDDPEDIPISRQAAMKKKSIRKEMPKPKRYKTVMRKRRKF